MCLNVAGGGGGGGGSVQHFNGVRQWATNPGAF